MPAGVLGGLHLSSCYFLKRSKIDISQNVKVSFCDGYGREPVQTSAGSEDFLKAAPLRSPCLGLVESMFSSLLEGIIT